MSYNTSISGKIIAKDQKGLSSEATFTAKTAELTEILDVNFEQDLIDKKIDSDSKINGLIKIEDALKVTVLDISGFDKRVTGRSDKKIKNLSGIEAFHNLTELDCSDNFLTNLDLSNNTLLKRLDCSNNNITTLNITKNTFLEYLECHVNNLTNLGFK